MSRPPKRKKPGEKVRVALRRNRQQPGRKKDWTRHVRDAGQNDLDLRTSESVVAKGDLSRQRTIVVHEVGEDAHPGWKEGVVIATRGLYADVDDGEHIVPCTIRRMLRTRLIAERGPLAVGDRVRFSVESTPDPLNPEGAVEAVQPRRSELRRVSNRRIQTIAANIDQAVIVTSAAEPRPKPQLVDRYIVAALHGGITPVICMNKIDLDADDFALDLLNLYADLNYGALVTSAATGEGIDELRALLAGKSSVIAGQSGVGKSSLLNAVQPGLGLKISAVAEHNEKGRHTTTTATLIKLDAGGYVVDTPGIRSYDISMIPRHELEAFFADFLRFIPLCKFPNCMHTHETGCAVKNAVERGEIDPLRYESYLYLLSDSSLS